MKLHDELKKRGLVYQFTDARLFDLYDKGGQKFYCGFDPTADSLHLGHFMSFMTAVNFMKRNNTFVMIIGGATGMIGDPSGKLSERTMLDEEKLRHNEQSISKQVQGILENLKKITGNEFKFEVINNYDFYKNMSVFEFLRTVGRYITVNNMLSKESIKKRIEDPECSITYTEFSYMLLQGYDFLHLYEKEGVKLQIGGSDQWGNMVTGTEMIRKKLGGEEQCFVMTFPLMTDSTGKKFGKSEGNAIWLNANKTSPYIAYQYFINAADEDVEKYLKGITLLSLEEIDEIVKKHKEHPEERYGQRQLGMYVTQTVYGKEGAAQAEIISKILFGNDDKLPILKSLKAKDFDALYQAIGGCEETGTEWKVLELFTKAGVTESNGEGKKLIQQGGLFCNEQKITDIQQIVTAKDSINNVFLLRKGKKVFKMVKIG